MTTEETFFETCQERAPVFPHDIKIKETKR